LPQNLDQFFTRLPIDRRPKRALNIFSPHKSFPAFLDRVKITTPPGAQAAGFESPVPPQD
jgi:hypothetical protein